MTDKNTNQLEDQLRGALRREEAPPNFAEQILARVAARNSPRQHARDPWWRVFSQPLLRWAAITATATAVVIAGIHYENVQRDRARGEAAKQQLMLALRIAGSKLQLAKSRVNEINATQTTN